MELKRKDQQRLNLVLSQRTRKQIDELQGILGADSLQETVRRCVGSVYEAATGGDKIADQLGLVFREVELLNGGRNAGTKQGRRSGGSGRRQRRG